MSIQTKIDARSYPVRDVLSNKYVVGYYQREYRWETKHVRQMIDDLETSFLNSYKETDSVEKVEDYNGYYLGPIVLSEKDGKKEIIDGQQRLTSMTLLLIYLKCLSGKDSLNGLIYSEKYEKRSFNLAIEEREDCLKDLYENGNYSVRSSDGESVRTMAARYEDIEESFPSELRGEKLPFFINWLIEKVVFVVITAYSDDNAYTVFETMNSRGLSITDVEMLKGYVLSQIGDAFRKEVERVWKTEIKAIADCGGREDEDKTFFQAWLRAKYAKTIREREKASSNKDFENIGTQFHIWVKDNRLEIGVANDSDFNDFVKKDMRFYADLYRKIRNAESVESALTGELVNVYYRSCWGFVHSLAYPLMMAPVMREDNEDTVNEKISLVARYVETFSVYKSVNRKMFLSGSIRHPMYHLVLGLRDNSVDELKKTLKGRLENSEENLRGIKELRLQSQNKKFVKFFLSRITAHIEQKTGDGRNFVKYFNGENGGKPYEIEHIWANNPEYQPDLQPDEFKDSRNRIGALILLPMGKNRSFGGDKYEDKYPHYYGENLLAKSLHGNCYQNNPDFVRYVEESGLPFKAHEKFSMDDIVERTALYQSVAEEIWSLDYFD